MQGFLTSFIQTDNQLDLTIQGDSTSSPFASLQPALSNLKLSTSLGGINFYLTSYLLAHDLSM